MFVTNWDTARNQGALTYKDGAKYQLANAFMLAYDYGTPRLLSDYKWDDGHNDDGAPGATVASVPDVDMNKECSTNNSALELRAALDLHPRHDRLPQLRQTAPKVDRLAG